MKKIQSLQYSTIFLVMLFIVSSPSFANWHEVKCPDENDYNTIVHFWDSVNVLFVQGDGDAAFSTDGGNVWDNPYYPR